MGQSVSNLCQLQQPKSLDEELSSRGYSSIETFSNNDVASTDSVNPKAIPVATDLVHRGRYFISLSGNSTLIVYIKQTHALTSNSVQPLPCKLPHLWTEYLLAEELVLSDLCFRFFRYDGDIFVSIKNNPGKVKLRLDHDVNVRSQTGYFVVRLEETYIPVGTPTTAPTAPLHVSVVN